MNNNSLSGAIPTDLARLKNLNHLILDHNQVTGPLPDALSTIPQLTIMYDASIPHDGHSSLGSPCSQCRLVISMTVAHDDSSTAIESGLVK